MWNPVREQIEGKLCEKGLMQETFDLEKNDLSRNLTPKGKLTAEELLTNPEWRRVYVRLAKEEFKQFPPEIRKILWKKVINQLRNI